MSRFILMVFTILLFRITSAEAFYSIDTNLLPLRLETVDSNALIITNQAMVITTNKKNISTNLFTVETNWSFITNDISNPALKPLSLYPLEPARIPNSYLKTGQLTNPDPETRFRRFDVVYFVAVPITYYLILNLMQVKNYWIASGRPLDSIDYNFILINTILIPFTVAYNDAVYVESRKDLFMSPQTASQNRTDYFGFNLRLFRAAF